ncbi:hypothetical protein IB234_10700 [Pseudomonas sp. PDM16]|uniref:hypothetical protein n=1 Tax=Pseudomonas sp. PDM16 TaxID=2769292 RepID=UPI001782C480|nr:hypothetical protein [Pseudomonas sp. PDM16]MBD9415028.1 hypothetical protein [Pseudomonas sp. PDM16]
MNHQKAAIETDCINAASNMGISSAKKAYVAPSVEVLNTDDTESGPAGIYDGATFS